MVHSLPSLPKALGSVPSMDGGSLFMVGIVVKSTPCQSVMLTLQSWSESVSPDDVSSWDSEGGHSCTGLRAAVGTSQHQRADFLCQPPHSAVSTGFVKQQHVNPVGPVVQGGEAGKEHRSRTDAMVVTNVSWDVGGPGNRPWTASAAEQGAPGTHWMGPDWGIGEPPENPPGNWGPLAACLPEWKQQPGWSQGRDSGRSCPAPWHHPGQVWACRGSRLASALSQARKR